MTRSAGSIVSYVRLTHATESIVRFRIGEHGLINGTRVALKHKSPSRPLPHE
ncbi:hypothetical protein BaRGS_00028654, partial [Batillaria attramentaria]